MRTRTKTRIFNVGCMLALSDPHAKYCPRQLRGPWMKGRNLKPSFSSSPMNRSGLYVKGSSSKGQVPIIGGPGAHYRWFRCPL